MLLKERGRMIDTAKWIEEFRSKDKTNWVNIEFDLEEDELDKVKQAAAILGMDFEEYVNYAVFKLIDEKYPPCATCKKPRPDASQPCNFCGEIDS